ncbi:MAG TPA: sulfatase-like hydrolase/transferase, partial [Tepidisphaeraceae bacterium]|nr:sulfatase-like hydrolase/transferase [Tepidisphaeraceae bacterium]
LIDDMGYTDFSCYGGTRTQTTNIDHLASEGIKFTQFYVAAPICSPSRVGFTTGQYPNRWHITSYLETRKRDEERGMVDWLNLKAPTLARTLHDNGYYTAHVGKWHMGGARDCDDAPLITEYGFDTSLTSFEGLGDRIHPLFDGEDRRGPWTPNAKTGHGKVSYVERYRETQTFVDRALAEMDNAAKANKPFYINLWPDDVHSPCLAPPKMRGDKSPAANYVGVLKELDNQFGRVFDHIKNDGKLRDNTIIVIASDNGPEKGMGLCGDLRGSKGQLYEGGIRLPLIVWSSRIEKSAVGSTNGKTVVSAVDLAPSLLAISDINKPADVKYDGSDMSAVLLGKSKAPRETPVMWVRPPDRPGPNGQLPDLAIRDGKWKVLVKRDGSNVELFDIFADPNEKKNLAKAEPEIAKKLSEQVIAWDQSIPQKAVAAN